MRFSTLVREAHANAREKGWHVGEERTLNRAGALIALIHSEVVEADAAWPQAFDVAEELADILIRLADAFGFFAPGWEFHDFHLGKSFDGESDEPASMCHGLLATCGTEELRKHGKPCPQLPRHMLGACQTWLRDTMLYHEPGAPADAASALVQAIKAKMEHNKTRSFRHGGKLL